MNRMSGNPDQQPAGELRAWHLAAERMRRIEAAWDDPGKRLRGILACKRWLERQEHVPRLVRLAALLDLPLTAAAQNVVPVAVTAAESVGQLRNWASGRCLNADAPGIYVHDQAPAAKPVRQVRRGNPSSN